MTPEWREAVLSPPLHTADVPGIGGRLRARLEDFEVIEIPAYDPDGGSGHVLVQMRKRGLATHEAIDLVARACSVSPRDVGYAGRKDRDAVTEQRLSFPASAVPGLAAFTHPQIELGPPQPHSHKLKMGHLRANRFRIVVRDLAVDVVEARRRIDAKVAALQTEGGAPNTFGPQRFGREGAGLDRGLAAIRNGRGGPRGNMIVAAGQAGLFNLYSAVRRQRGAWRRVLLGDVLQKTDTGGLFDCSDPIVDGARFDAGQLVVTGPMFGSRMRSATPSTPAAELEAEVLAIAGIEASALKALGNAARGTRRGLTMPLDAVEVGIATAEDNLSRGVCIAFALPAGGFATTVCSELMGSI
jgi:tRNA pseudouridine13 synthase